MPDKYELMKKLLHAMFRFKKVRVELPPDGNIHISEIIAMKRINDTKDGNIFEPSSVANEMHVSKAAVSQTISSLENKGYITRQIGKSDKRRFEIMLTDKGKRLVEIMDSHVERQFTEIIEKFGKDNTLELIRLINEFSDIAENVHADITLKELEEI